MLGETLLDPIIQYCERKDAALLAEPLGLFSNMAFFFAAAGVYFLGRTAAREGTRRRLYVLSAEACTVGVGSSLYHAWPNLLTMAADVLPILLFFSTFGFFYFQTLRIEEGAWVGRALLALLFLVLPGLVAVRLGFSAYLSGGEYYLGLAPAFFYLASAEQRRLRAVVLFLASLTFATALVVRSVDNPLCTVFPYGTHFLWHLFTSALIFVLAAVLFLPDLETGPFQLREVKSEAQPTRLFDNGRMTVARNDSWAADHASS